MCSFMEHFLDVFFWNPFLHLPHSILGGERERDGASPLVVPTSNFAGCFRILKCVSLAMSPFISATSYFETGAPLKDTFIVLPIGCYKRAMYSVDAVQEGCICK